MIRRSTAACGVLLALAGLSGCGSDSVAGKTTTTGNGGGLVALGPDGRAASGCLVLAARSWDPVHGLPGTVDTLRSDSSGHVALPQEAYAFLEIQDSGRAMGAWTKRLLVPEGTRRTIVLDTMRSLAGRWADRAGISEGRLYLDSSFRTTRLADVDGSFAFGTLPTGDYAVMLKADAQLPRSMGSVRLAATDVRYMGSGNLVVTGDTTGSPLWIDDFESGTLDPLIRQSIPAMKPWYMWWIYTDMTRPSSTEPDSLLRAIGPDSTRPGRSLHVRFASQSAAAWVAAGVYGMEIDLSARTKLCFSYRTDTLLKLQFQRDSVAGGRPTLFTMAPSSPQWRDLCVETSSFAGESQTPDSLSSWSTFGKRVLALEFQVPGGGTYLDLDDIRLR